MQRAALAGSEAAALFLATHGAKVNHANRWVRLNTSGTIGRVGLGRTGGTTGGHERGS